MARAHMRGFRQPFHGPPRVDAFADLFDEARETMRRAIDVPLMAAVVKAIPDQGAAAVRE